MQRIDKLITEAEQIKAAVTGGVGLIFIHERDGLHICRAITEAKAGWRTDETNYPTGAAAQEYAHGIATDSPLDTKVIQFVKASDWRAGNG